MLRTLGELVPTITSNGNLTTGYDVFEVVMIADRVLVLVSALRKQCEYLSYLRWHRF